MNQALPGGGMQGSSLPTDLPLSQNAPPHGIHELIAYPYRIPWEWILSGIIGGALLTALLYWAWKKFRSSTSPSGGSMTEKPVDPLPGLESRLKDLTVQEPFTGKNAEEFYYQLSIIFRGILEICCRFPATDLTRRELESPVRSISFLNLKEKEFILDFMGRSDQIKFAGAVTEKNEATEYKEQVIQMSQKLIKEFRQSLATEARDLPPKTSETSSTSIV